MWQRLTEKARFSIFRAQEYAGKHNGAIVTPEALFCGLMHPEDNTKLRSQLSAMGIDVPALLAATVKRMSGRSDGPEQAELSAGGKKVIDYAHDEARDRSSKSITTRHLLCGILLEAEENGNKHYADFGLTYAVARMPVADPEGVWPPPPATVTPVVPSKRHVSRLKSRRQDTAETAFSRAMLLIVIDLVLLIAETARGPAVPAGFRPAVWAYWHRFRLHASESPLAMLAFCSCGASLNAIGKGKGIAALAPLAFSLIHLLAIFL